MRKLTISTKTELPEIGDSKKPRKQWYINDPNNADIPEYGPYTSREEAVDDRNGLQRFYDDNSDT